MDTLRRCPECDEQDTYDRGDLNVDGVATCKSCGEPFQIVEPIRCPSCGSDKTSAIQQREETIRDVFVDRSGNPVFYEVEESYRPVDPVMTKRCHQCNHSWT